MKINFLIYILYLSLISLIASDNLPIFEISEVYHEGTRCDNENGFFVFIILGKGTGIDDEIRITLPLKSPENCKAVCMVSSEKMNCTMDAYLYDLEGEKILEVFEEEPIFDNLKISNWVEYFIDVRRILNHATNCKAVERKIEPDKDEEHIFAAYDAKNIEILGCFRNKNNFSFQLTRVKDEGVDTPDSLTQDIYFEINFEKPANDKALCVIPKKSIDDVYTVRCALEYGGEIEIGKEVSGVVNLQGKKLKIVFRGLLIPPTIVDECKNEKNNN